jgi:N-acetylated-alpha-linked acidic dipeptidase
MWPLRPFTIERADRLSTADIPSLPLSYEDALPLLRALNGKGPCFDDWKGGLGYEGVHYCSGPSEGNLTMTNDVVDDIRPIW